MANKIFTQSENFKSEYSCAVVRVGELTPIEGSDFLAKTDVFGTQIVVRKDQVKEGDVMIYAANETALNSDFLSVNNLYEVGCRERNANAAEVETIMAEYMPIKLEADKKRTRAKTIKGMMDSMTIKAQKINNKIRKKEKILAGLDERVDDEAYTISNEIADLKKQADGFTAKALSMTSEYVNLKKEIDEMVKSGEHIIVEAKKHCGFFNKYGRVRCLTLKGCPSFGFLFSPNELFKFDSNITMDDILEYEGQEFDTVNGVLFVKVYVPPVAEQKERNSNKNKTQNKVEKFNRMVEGEFFFHYNTTQLQKTIQFYKPDDVVDISVKLHGTSVIIGKLHIKDPIRLPFFKRMFNKFVDSTGLMKSKRIQDWVIKYGPVYSSRTVIKNKYINKEVGQGFYSQDIWSQWGDIIYPYLDEGMTIYGEIVGYLTGSDTMIQKAYDYGCEKGKNKLMIYRITTTNEDGTKKEWDILDVRTWTKQLIDRMKLTSDPNWENIHPIDWLYHGTFKDLYPDLDVENHWHVNLLERLKNDKEHFGMEENEPMCTHYEVPREGICIRKVGDEIPRCDKLKTVAFAFGEAIRMDQGDVDSEMIEGYSEDDATDQ